MQELLWNITKFNELFSYPSDVQGGAEAYAQDIVNLRVDRWGHLRLRPIIRALQMRDESDIAPDGTSITGVAAGPSELYWLRSDAELYFARDIPADVFRIRNVRALSGRLSLVDQIGDDKLVILTSEGDDHGYSISNSVAEPLGLTSPEEDDFTINLGPGVVPDQLDDDYTFYRITYSGTGQLGNLESGSFRYAVRLRQFLGLAMGSDQQAELDAGGYYLQFQLDAKPADLRITHLNIYRSSARFPDEDTLDSQILYYKIGQHAVAANAGNYPQNFQDSTLKTTVDVATPFVDNSLLPEGATQIALFNDRLFAANTNELRFSDVRGVVPHWHAWPVLHSITTGQRVESCIAYRGMLLFGAADNLWRLSGTSPHTFARDQIAQRGPVSPHAWGVLDNALGFVGSDGLYLTDGTQAPEMAAPLKGYFNRHEIEGGFVGLLPNQTSLWGVSRRNKSTNAVDDIYFVKDGNDWTRIAEGSDSTHIRQYASVRFDGLPITGVIADQQRAPRLIDWIVDDETVDEITNYTGGTAITEAIPWSWESQQLDWNAQGLGSEMKQFKELEIDGAADSDITITFYVDNLPSSSETVTLNRMADERFDHRRVRIARRGFALRFKIEGTGDVLLRGLKVRTWV